MPYASAVSRTAPGFAVGCACGAATAGFTTAAGVRGLLACESVGLGTLGTRWPSALGAATGSAVSLATGALAATGGGAGGEAGFAATGNGVPPSELFAAVTKEVGRLLSGDLVGMIRFDADETVVLSPSR